METQQWKNERDTAKILGLSVFTLRNWRSLRKGPKYTILGERAIRYELQDIIDFAEMRKVNMDN